MRPEPSSPLDPRAVTVWRLSAALGDVVPSLIAIVVAALLAYFDIVPWTIVGAVFAIGAAVSLLFVVVVPSLRYRRWRYEVTDDEIDLREGVIIVKRTLIPLVRVQHVDTHQGPIMRAFGLAGVNVATAAGAHEIPALSVEGADALRDRISALARVAEDDV